VSRRSEKFDQKAFRFSAQTILLLYSPPERRLRINDRTLKLGCMMVIAFFYSLSVIQIWRPVLDGETRHMMTDLVTVIGR
jgi:hypothetical protein